MRTLVWLLIVPAAFSLMPVAAAQSVVAAPVAQDGKRIFTPDFFTAYAPVSALDMVERVPGFSIFEGDDRRGFGQNAGNVLIEGSRPSTKSDNIRTILSRIPADQVARVELTEQAGNAADARGQALTVNVVRMANASLNGTYSASVEFGERSDISPFGDASVSLKRGATTYDLSAAYSRQYNRQDGPQITRDGRGRLIERRFQDARSTYREASLSGGLKTVAGDTKINLNARGEFDLERTRRSSDIFNPAAILAGTEFLLQRAPDIEKAYEVGGDIELPIGPGVTSKLIGLHTWATEKGDGLIATDRLSQGSDIFTTLTRNRSAESIVRLQNEWAAAAAHSVQFGAEVALNRLRANFSAASSANGTVIQFPASNVQVREWRYEPFISDVWSISNDWKLETGLIYERSSLRVRGDASASRSLQFFKPRAVATWTMSKTSSLEFRVQRDVNQLDFNDFATSVDLGSGAQVDAGNAELVPQRTWTVETVWRQKFWDRGSIQFATAYRFLSQIQDLVPISQRDVNGAILSRFDGAGNIGSGRRIDFELEVTLPLDRITRSLGFAGMEIKYVGHYHHTRVSDPVTGLARHLSGQRLHHHDVNFRHDIPGSGISWGFDMNYAAPQSRYFFNQVQRDSAGPEFFTWVEYKKWAYGTLRFQVGNPTDIAIRRTWSIYRDTRATNDLAQTITRDRSRDTRFLFSLSGKF